MFLIFFAVLVMLGIGVFVYREVFPEYKTYQYAYRDLEKLRSERTGEEPAPFQMGIKQILIPDTTNGPEIIDRCTSCHVAIDLPHFSPTRVALDVNDNPLINGEGNPILEKNPDYVFAHVNDQKFDFAKEALKMHPLIGGETRPFQHHPIDEYGCTSCHSGNGRALVKNRAHGPIYDDEYELWDPKLKKPQFLEIDPNNDPLFSKMYNGKPSHELVFQTKPLMTGPLIVAKCMQCHQTSQNEVKSLLSKIDDFKMEQEKRRGTLEQGIIDDQKALASIDHLQILLKREGDGGALQWLNQELQNSENTSDQIDAYEGQYTFIKEHKNPLNALAEERTRVERLLQEKEHSLTKENPLLVVEQNQEVVQNVRTHLDYLLAGYERGKQLYISQACYACHRIAGFSRASVGPELTTIGLNYPWYVKESIVWPQADLPSSTMPNFHLDHEEVADLMSFLMAQTGERKVVSEVEHQLSLAQWEAGEKMAWEKPVSPTQILDVKEGMLVYATEGCAACHKLEGFDSKYEVHDTAWFLRTFPDGAPGSKIAFGVETEREAIDTQIVQIEKTSLLDEINFEEFYSNFKFAERALSDPADKERLKKVQRAYIQEYGLGREIAPPLNWSGVNRDEGWLLGHFHNPPGYTAKSIMPVMPFDDTKFYMLNHMLYVLGKKNQHRFQQMWKTDGFKPAEAYELLCSACHGPNRQGNGLVAEWIYPVPKNLRDPVFLRSLTKERAIDSITHGVMGTPMPPWGEAVEGQSPVLDATQITQMVDWLYQGLPPEPREGKRITEKWNYTAEDVVEEMKKEGDLLQPVPNPVDVNDYFEVRPNPISGPDRELFYIQTRFATAENLDEAGDYYNINCAVCHGKDGTGAGERSTTMLVAKPRMFTNLPWIRTRDDLRLLRSIKFGVPGTAMTPWGDQTTAAQRMQLVLYIRAMTDAHIQREKLDEVTYEWFDKKIIQLYISGDPAVERLKKEKELYHNLGAQIISKELPNHIVESYLIFLEKREGRPEELITYLDQVITEYQKKIEEAGISEFDPLADKEGQKWIALQRGYINLRTAIFTTLANAKKLQEDYSFSYAQ
ncbi:MAG: hypothetical protein S4CHLAM45_11050 [Chlamydiales bacterium]|nr:hypothetical protein [Chlamydiales bacterium]MCH9619597.1 hypothetical protein [Chlamydiales bacterium]MCH9623203.1 hypothetical protein [Chlamydiales bacterium]